MAEKVVTVIDYGAGNVRSVVNAVEHLGWTVKMASTAAEIMQADRLIFPGVGAFGSAMRRLNDLGFVQPIRDYVKTGKPFFGVCLGMQTLFEASEESPGVEGLGVIPGKITRFAVKDGSAVPAIGWNGVRVWKKTHLVDAEANYYFVHSFVADVEDTPAEWILTTTDYGGQRIVSSVQKGNVFATQFHPEKSSTKGLALIKHFLEITHEDETEMEESYWGKKEQPETQMAKRIIACLDVRANDRGDIVVTKGDQYDVREEGADDAKGEVRNLGKPVELAERYYKDGADEITFLNITAFRGTPLKDQPMLEVLRQTSKRVFVPLCVGGGIRSFTDPDGGEFHSAVDVAGEYFRSGADKVSLGSDAVDATLQYLADPEKFDRETCSISTISERYGAQAVVISVDPKRVYEKEAIEGRTFKALTPGPNGETECWYQCTTKGGRETVDLSARALAQTTEKLGAGEILLNCIDHDGQNQGFETALVSDVKANVSIPVIASSGAGHPDHFPEVFRKANPDAALAAGIFHRNEVSVGVCSGGTRFYVFDILCCSPSPIQCTGGEGCNLRCQHSRSSLSYESRNVTRHCIVPRLLS